MERRKQQKHHVKTKLAIGGSRSVFCQNLNYIRSTYHIPNLTNVSRNTLINRIYEAACQHEPSQEAGCITDLLLRQRTAQTAPVMTGYPGPSMYTVTLTLVVNLS